MIKYIIANWKMNFSLNNAIDFCKQAPESIIIAAPLPYLAYLSYNFPNLSFASQDVSHIKDHYGAFTGETSSKMLCDIGLKYAIVGHSERRSYNGETNDVVKQKAINCINNSIIPIICIGENRECRDKKEYLAFIKQQIQESVPDSDKVIIAYEPVWSIGTGNIPTISELEEVFCLIENLIAKTVPLVYGGSVNSGNISEIIKVTRIKGLLLGKSSLSIDEVNNIIRNW